MNSDEEKLMPSITLEKGDTTPLSLEELRQSCREQVARIFARSAPDIARGMVSLALTAENEHARIRASERILNEFNDHQSAKQMPGTSVQIINAIPFERAAYDDKGRELQQVLMGKLRMATPEYKSDIPQADPEIHDSRENFRSGSRRSAASVDKLEMKSIGPASDTDVIEGQLKVR